MSKYNSHREHPLSTQLWLSEWIVLLSPIWHLLHKAIPSTLGEIYISSKSCQDTLKIPTSSCPPLRQLAYQSSSNMTCPGSFLGPCLLQFKFQPTQQGGPSMVYPRIPPPIFGTAPASVQNLQRYTIYTGNTPSRSIEIYISPDS